MAGAARVSSLNLVAGTLLMDYRGHLVCWLSSLRYPSQPVDFKPFARPTAYAKAPAQTHLQNIGSHGSHVLQ